MDKISYNGHNFRKDIDGIRMMLRKAPWFIEQEGISFVAPENVKIKKVFKKQQKENV